MSLGIRKVLQNYSLLLILILVILMSSLISEHFLSFTNFLNVIRQISMVSIIAVGSTIVIMSGGIDLSIGSVATLGGVLFAGLTARNNLPIPIALLIVLLFGALAGLLNGGITVGFSVPPFIVTLATMYIFQGITNLYAGGGYTAISGVPKGFDLIGSGYIWHIPIPIIIMAIVFVIFILFLKYTKYGLYIYCVGGNETASKLFGVNVKLIKLMAYMIGGLLSALGGSVLASRLNSGNVQACEFFLFMAITAVILGGTSLKGGEGTLIGTLIGAVILGIIYNILNLANVNYFYQFIIHGAVLMFAVIIQVLLAKRET